MTMKPQGTAYEGLKDELLLTREEIAARVAELGAQITRDYKERI